MTRVISDSKANLSRSEIHLLGRTLPVAHGSKATATDSVDNPRPTPDVASACSSFAASNSATTFAIQSARKIQRPLAHACTLLVG